jgi:hypothetical protein
MTGALSFDSNSLQTYSPTTRVGIITNDIDFSDIATKSMSMFPIANSNLSAISSVNYPNKTITITGGVSGSSASDLDSRLDTFRGYFIGTDKNLDITYNGSTRRFIATANTVNITRGANGKYATFSIEFICTSPFGTDTSNTTALSATGRTGSSYSDAYIFLGTAPAQLPVITITINSLTGGTGAYILVGNDDTGQQIIVTNNFSADDVLEIDCYNKTVKLNGTDVDFVGGFPEFVPGASHIDYADNFTTRNFDISVVYKKLYL